MDDIETLHLIENAGRAFSAQWGGAARARAYQSHPLRRDGELWNAVAGQGWIGLMVPEGEGGLGLSVRALMTLALELGRSLVLSPILPAIASSLMLARIKTAPALAALARNLSGEGLSLSSLPVSGTLLGISSAKRKAVGGWLHDSHQADAVIVLDAEAGRAGYIPLSSVGPDIFQLTMDGGSVGAVYLDAIPDEYLIGGDMNLRPILAELQDVLAIGTAAMLIGCTRAALSMSLEYLRTRKQFGRTIGAFQALQHRAATLHVAVASTEAFLFEAASSFEGDNRSGACAAVRARAADCALDVVKEAVQFHGAIGFADEYDLGMYFRRVVALSAWYGNSAHWRKMFSKFYDRTAEHSK